MPFRYYHASVHESIAEWRRGGRDRLFHGAPAAVLVGSRPGAACPKEDALLAAQNILLGAHAMGLGTCLIGFAVSALEHAPWLKDVLDIPRSESIHAVIALGFPDETYIRLTGRKSVPVRIWPKTWETAWVIQASGANVGSALSASRRALPRASKWTAKK